MILKLILVLNPSHGVDGDFLEDQLRLSWPSKCIFESMLDPYLEPKLITKIGSGGSGSKKIIQIHNTGGNNKKTRKP
jgi:hypothetical protein